MTENNSAKSNGRTVATLVGVVVVMGALAWAAVPFYDWFCRVTGYGGTTNVAAQGSDDILEEKVRVRFDANVDPGMGWTFRPLQHDIEIRIGENAMAFYEAINTTDQPITGTASYNVSPDVAGYYFNKIQCFCFTEQTLQPGERIEMPVNFFVDAGIVNDRDAGKVRDITLSYTFHRTEPSTPKQAAVDGNSTPTVN